jgi:hypothetical protein
MTDLLDDKIRLLMVQIVEASPTAQELEGTIELRLSTEPDPAVAQLLPQVEQPRRPWLVAVASAAAVLLVVGGVALLLRVIGSDTPVATTPADPSSSLTWSRVPYDEVAVAGDFDQMMRSVTVGGPGLVAVGTAGDAGISESLRATVWTSVDGTDWSRVPHDKTVFGGGRMNSVTAGGPGLVAVGAAVLEGEDWPSVAAVWTSVDGVTWSRVSHDEEVFGGAYMTSVTAGGPGLVAVGSDGDFYEPWGNAVVWTSPDGVTWSRVPHDDAIFGEGWTAMHSVTVGGPGLVAVGTTDAEEDDPVAMVWTSVDGTKWSRVPHDEAVFGGASMNSVTAGGPGLVAVGATDAEGDDPDAAVVWTSVDGIDWSRIPHDETVFGLEDTPSGGAEGMSSVTVGGSGLVAVGSDSMTLDSGRWVVVAAVWTSVDGIDWSRVPHNEKFFAAPPVFNHEMNSITTGSPGLVAVGTSFRGYVPASGGESDAAVWVAEPGQ